MTSLTALRYYVGPLVAPSTVNENKKMNGNTPRCAKHTCHDSKDFLHERQVVGLVELGGKV